VPNESLQFLAGTTTSNWQYFIGLQIVAVTGAMTLLRWLELRHSQKKQTVGQRWTTVRTLLLFLLGALAVLIARTEFRASEARAAANDAEVKDQEKQIVVLKQGALDASKKQVASAVAISEAEKRASKANRRAEKALRKGEEERIARLALEEKLKARRLFEAQQEELARRLKSFPQFPIGVQWTDAGGQETADLAGDFLGGIAKAGIKISNSELMVGVYVRGVYLRVGRNRLAEAEVIAGFLVEAGLSDDPVHAWTDDDPQALSIVIGAKM
jgi:hypothetical protein